MDFKKVKAFDLHSDLPTTAESEKIKIALKCKEQGYLVANAIYRGERTFDKSFELANQFVKSGLKVAFEDCCYNDYFAIGESVNHKRLISLCENIASVNPLYVSLGWNFDNLFCGGCRGESGLTHLGREVIEFFNFKNIVIDTAHLNKKSFLEIARLSNKVVCSHTAFNWVYPHKRNIDKEQVRTILDKGGLIGAICVGHFLTGVKLKSDYKKAYFEHIKSYVELFGVEGLCIGSDFYGSDAPVYEHGDYSFICQIAQFLLKMGYNQTSVEKVLYKNAMKYLIKE